MSRTTQALVVPTVGGPFKLCSVQLGIMDPEEVLVEIHFSGICHTDISCAQGKLPCADGAILGHEGAGVVLEVGSLVSTVSVGDKVLLSFSHCEQCPACISGHPAYCHHFNERNFGGLRPNGTSAFLADDGKGPRFSSFFGQSSFARHTLVHKSTVVKVPQDTDLSLLAPLGCGIQTGFGAVVNTLGVKADSSVAVFGVGSVGIAAVIAAKLASAKTIIAVDIQESRVTFAKKLGATHGIINSANIVNDIRAICPPLGVDFAVECSGRISVIRDMVDSLGTRGRAATVGAPGFGQEVNVDVMGHLSNGKEYVGCCEGDSLPTKLIPDLIELQKQGKLQLEELVSIYSVHDFAKAFADSASGAALKAVLRWDDAM